MLDLSEEPLEENVGTCVEYLKRMAKCDILLEMELGVTVTPIKTRSSPVKPAVSKPSPSTIKLVRNENSSGSLNGGGVSSSPLARPKSSSLVRPKSAGRNTMSRVAVQSGKIRSNKPRSACRRLVNLLCSESMRRPL